MVAILSECKGKCIVKTPNGKLVKGYYHCTTKAGFHILATLLPEDPDTHIKGELILPDNPKWVEYFIQVQNA